MRATLQPPDSLPVAKAESNREVILVAVFILFSSVSYFLIQYDRLRTMGPGLEDWVNAILAGTVAAPIQYRIALPYLAHLFAILIHLQPNQSLPLIESAAYLFALTLLYRLFRGSPQVEHSSPTRRLIVLGLFLAAAQYPVLWIFPWERPETLPCAVYLAAIVLLVARPRRIPFAVICVFTLILSLGQALIRADVPVIVGVAILLSAALSIPFPSSRTQVAIVGLLSCVTGGGTQLYLQCIAYRTATYPADTPRIQLLTNLNPLYAPFHIPIFLTVLLPLMVSVLLWRRYRIALDSSDKLVLLMCLLYLPVWITTGLMAEVRIFVPFLFLASPTIAKIWTGYLLNEGDSVAALPAV